MCACQWVLLIINNNVEPLQIRRVKKKASLWCIYIYIYGHKHIERWTQFDTQPSPLSLSLSSLQSIAKSWPLLDVKTGSAPRKVLQITKTEEKKRFVHVPS